MEILIDLLIIVVTIQYFRDNRQSQLFLLRRAGFIRRIDSSMNAHIHCNLLYCIILTLNTSIFFTGFYEIYEFDLIIMLCMDRSQKT